MRRLTPLLLLLLQALAQAPGGLPEGLFPAKGPLAVVLPLPQNLALPQGVAEAATEVRVLVPAPYRATARLPRSLEALRGRVPFEVRTQTRPPLLAPGLAGPNYLYLPGAGWTDLAGRVGIFWRLFNEAWKASSR